MNPFFWNGCEFVLNPYSSDFSWIIAWTKKWIDEADEMPEDSCGLSGVIHSVTSPEVVNGSLLFSVDFGSAGVDAFMELIEGIRSQGTKSFKIRTSSIKVRS